MGEPREANPYGRKLNTGTDWHDQHDGNFEPEPLAANRSTTASTIDTDFISEELAHRAGHGKKRRPTLELQSVDAATGKRRRTENNVQVKFNARSLESEGTANADMDAIRSSE
jgi:hypothetical protein